MKEVSFHCGSCESKLRFENGFYRCYTCLLKIPEQEITCPCCHSSMLPYRCELPVVWESVERGHGLVCSNLDCPLYEVHKTPKTITLRYNNDIIYKEYSEGYRGRRFAIAHYYFKTNSIYRTDNANRNVIMCYLKRIINRKLNIIF